MKRFFRLVSVLVMAGLGISASAQTPTGIVQGTVAETTGASVQGASITITRTETNENRTATSDSSGRYTIPFVQPGTYTVTVRATGFRPESQQNIIVEVAGTRPVDFILHVGQVTEQVQVSATTENLDVATSSLGETIQTKLILELPDNGRNPFDFALLVPGVNNAGNASTPHIGGSRNGNNEQQIDGMTNILPENNVGNNSSAYTPVLDSVQEVNVQTSVLPAEYGRFSGGTISLITKSGTNMIHGTFFEFLESSGLAAKPFGSGSAAKPDAHRYQTGGTIGGPIVIPHLYNGHDKSFFFFDFEDSRQSNGVQQTYSVPQPQWLTGNFSDLSTTIYDPLTVHKDANGNFVRDPFPGNIIPASRLATPASQVAQNILKYFPTPTKSGLFNNFTQVGTTTNNYYHWDTRVDQDMSKKWHAFVRFAHFVGNSVPLNDYKNAASPGGYNGPNSGTAWSLSFNNTVTFNPTMLGEFRYGFSKSTSLRTAFNEGFKLTTLGFPQSFQDQAGKNALLFPHFGFSQGYSDLGTQGYVPLLENPLAHDLNGSLVKILGAHSIKVGAEYRILNLEFYQYAYPSGTFNVDNSWTQASPQKNDGSGNPFASLLLGLPSGGDITNEPKVNSTSGYWAFYGQDDWKATPTLTLNLGLRWDFEVPRVEQHNQMSYWNPTAPSPLAGKVTAPAGVTCTACSNLMGQMVIVGTAASKYGRRQGPIQWGDVAPRVGVAWNPLPKVAVRSGFGIVYQPSAMQAAGTSGAPGIQGFRVQTNFSPSFNNQQSAPVADLANLFPSGYLTPQAKDPACLSNPSCVQGIDIGNGISESYFNSYRNPYSIQWNASVQYALPASMKFEVGYLGNHGLFLIDGDPGITFDQLPTSYLSMGNALLDQVPNPFFGIINVPGSGLSQPTVQRSQLLRKYPQYGGVSSFRKPYAGSIYHGLTLRLDKQFSQGLSFTLSFTGGKSLDNGSSAVNYLGTTSQTFADQYNPKAERSLSAFDVSKQFVGSTVYELPLGRGKMFLGNLGRAPNLVVGGWQIGGIVNYASGTPIVLSAVNNGTTQSAIFTQGQRPAWNGKDANLSSRNRKLWFNTAAFSVPAPFTIGNAPRSLPNVRNPSYNNLDMTFTKNTYFTERYNLQFRVEMFNAFNHALLGTPDVNITDGTFGQIGSGSFGNSARQIQLGFKFYF